MTVGALRSAAAATALLLATAAACPTGVGPGSVRAVRVSADTRTVYALESNGTRRTLLRARPNERFFPDYPPANAPAPSLSPDRHWVLVERIYPFRARGRVDESTLLVNLCTGRRIVRTGTKPFLGVPDANAATWISDAPETLRVTSPNGTPATVDLRAHGRS